MRFASGETHLCVLFSPALTPPLLSFFLKRKNKTKKQTDVTLEVGIGADNRLAAAVINHMVIFLLPFLTFFPLIHNYVSLLFISFLPSLPILVR